jgi:acetyltransferase-like isoleucine patch superfamily enzyme
MASAAEHNIIARGVTRAERRAVAAAHGRQGKQTGRVSRLRSHAAMLRASVHVRYALANALCSLLPTFFAGSIRARVYRKAGFRVGRGAVLTANVRFIGAGQEFYENLVIGPNTIVSDHVTINLDAPVVLGANVAVGPRVVIYTATHRIGPGSRRMGSVGAVPVTIEDGAWVRLGAVLVPGVTVGRGSIVAAGAVVLHDVPPNTYVEGNPATVTRRLGWADR